MGENLAAQFLLDPEVTFLNHGSFGACPEPVLEAQRVWRDRLDRIETVLPKPDEGAQR